MIAILKFNLFYAKNDKQNKYACGKLGTNIY